MFLSELKQVMQQLVGGSAMNSRERVSQAMNYVQPDRVPVDFGAHRSSGIMAIAYARLRDHLGLPKRPIKVYDIPQQLAVIDEDVRERFNCDAIEMGYGFCLDDSDWHPWVLPDGTDCLIPRWFNPVLEDGNWVVYSANGVPIAIQKKGVLYFEQIHWPYEENPAKNMAEIDLYTAMENSMWSSSVMASPPGPTPPGVDPAQYLTMGAKRLRESTDRTIVGLFGGTIFEGGQRLFGMEEFYYLLGSDVDFVHRYLENLTNVYLEMLESWLGAVGPYIDVILFGDDYGMQTGPQISPKMFREVFKPYHKAMWTRSKELAPDVQIHLHSCGAISGLLDDMIDAGLEQMNPVQIKATGMEPETLKRDFGGRIVFWGGGCDTQQVLWQEPPEGVRQHVLHNLDVFMPGGGFIFQQVHNIMANVPPENIVAMFDAVQEWNETHG
jgi:uroporphyrinogen decarboxylase